MAECDWEACGPITHKFRIAKTIEAAVFPQAREIREFNGMAVSTTDWARMESV